MRFRSEGGYILGLLGLLIAVAIVGGLASLAIKTYFGPQSGVAREAREAAGVTGPETPVQYKGVID
jgi:type II secretory pathway pseudopilin PulG